jgi:hypothetical protein
MVEGSLIRIVDFKGATWKAKKFPAFFDEFTMSVTDELSVGEVCICVSGVCDTPWGAFVRVVTPRGKIGWISTEICETESQGQAIIL